MSSESPFGKPLDAAILAEPPAPPKNPLPVATLVSIAIPAAAFAGASLLQKAVDGPAAHGDLLGRWIVLSCGIGLLLGVIAALALGRTTARRALFIAWGALSPLLVAALVLGIVRAVHPVREAISDRAAERCKLTRKVCSAGEFRALCGSLGSGTGAKERGAALLGAPDQSLCDGQGCTHRWSYPGPWTPDNWVAPGSILCSVVVDASGASKRSSVVAGNEAP